MKSFVASFTALLACASGSCSSEVPAVRSYFYAGGQYVDDGAGGHIFRDQMYVERLQPAGGAKNETPIVFIHGQAQTGTVRQAESPNASIKCMLIRLCRTS